MEIWIPKNPFAEIKTLSFLDYGLSNSVVQKNTAALSKATDTSSYKSIDLNALTYCKTLPDRLLAEAKHTVWNGVQQTVMLGAKFALDSFGARTPHNLLTPLNNALSSMHTWIDNIHSTSLSSQYQPRSNIFGLSFSEGYLPFPVTTAPAVASRVSNLGRAVFSRQNLGIGESVTKSMSILNGKQIWSETRNKTAVQNAFKHWRDHKKEFPELLNSRQYVEKAHKFFRNRPLGTLIKTRVNGEILLYDPQT